jgi:hypothetical protein
VKCRVDEGSIADVQRAEIVCGDDEAEDAGGGEEGRVSYNCLDNKLVYSIL